MRDALMFACGAVAGAALMLAFCRAVIDAYVRERREAKARRLDLLKLHTHPPEGRPMNETKEIDLPCGCAVERETRPVVRYVAWCEEHFGRREGLRILTPENQAVVDAAAPLAAERGEREVAVARVRDAIEAGFVSWKASEEDEVAFDRADLRTLLAAVSRPAEARWERYAETD